MTETGSTLDHARRRQPRARSRRPHPSGAPSCDDLSLRATQSALERYAYVVHDLRDVVHAATLALEVVRKQVPEDVRGMPQLTSALEELRERLGDTVTAWRVSAGCDAWAGEELTTVGLRALAQDVLGELGARARRRSVHLRLHVPPEASVRGDAGLLRAGLRNLVDNAIRYSEPASAVTIRAYRADDRQVLEVTDGCRGFRPGRAHPGPATCSAEEGFGIGLRLTQRVAELHGGRLLRRDGRSGGCVFSLELASSAGEA